MRAGQTEPAAVAAGEFAVPAAIARNRLLRVSAAVVFHSFQRTCRRRAAQPLLRLTDRWPPYGRLGSTPPASLAGLGYRLLHLPDVPGPGLVGGGAGAVLPIEAASGCTAGLASRPARWVAGPMTSPKAAKLASSSHTSTTVNPASVRKQMWRSRFSRVRAPRLRPVPRRPGRDRR